jgi:hypothetical protein
LAAPRLADFSDSPKATRGACCAWWRSAITRRCSCPIICGRTPELGIFFGDDDLALAEDDYLRDTWLELKTVDPGGPERRLRDLGVAKVDYTDASCFYFQAPGSRVFRIAPLDGGL